jgi:hypothetical protein
MIVKFQASPQRYEPTTFDAFFDRIRRAFNLVPSAQEAVSFVLLQDADGIVWKVTVDTSGNLQTASVPLGQTGPNIAPS